jgi:hypothetical protein
LCFAVFRCLVYSLACAHTTLHTEQLYSILNIVYILQSQHI